MGNSLINSNGGYYDPGVKLSPRAVADIIENFEDTRDDTGFTMKGLAKLSKVSEPTAFKYVTVYEEWGVAGVVEYMGLPRAESFTGGPGLPLTTATGPSSVQSAP